MIYDYHIYNFMTRFEVLILKGKFNHVKFLLFAGGRVLFVLVNMLEKIGLPPKPSMRGASWVVDATHCQGCSVQFSLFTRKVFDYLLFFALQ
jgi:hypothetical protein